MRSSPGEERDFKSLLPMDRHRKVGPPLAVEGNRALGPAMRERSVATFVEKILSHP
jgi:hypothetical protein